MVVVSTSAAPAHTKDSVPQLSAEECLRAGEQHLADLADHQRTPPGAVPPTRWPRMRVLHEWLTRVDVRVLEAFRRAWRGAWGPKHLLGRWKAHFKLLRPRETLGPVFLGFVVLLVVSGWVAFRASDDLDGSVWRAGETLAVSKALFGVALLGILGALWTNLGRCPFIGYRIRRRIRREPEAMLLVNLGARKKDVVPRREPLPIVPRTELYYDVLPGVLARDHKDLQIVVGDPGSGKTTALLGLAALLARIGIVSVLVPLRTERTLHLVKLAEERFKTQVEEFVRSDAEGDVLWNWLLRRRRIAILADDVDQIGTDGERGFVLRQTLVEAQTYGLPIIVTTRPAGVPAGIAASAVTLHELDEKSIVDNVLAGARDDPGFKPSYVTPRQWLVDWVREGDLAEVPFYLELLAQLAAAGECPKLVDGRSLAAETERRGRYRARPDGRYQWNPLWVRFRLLEAFAEKVRSGRIRPWLGIQPDEREGALHELERAALGSLVATGLSAAAERHGRSERQRELARPQRTRLQEFINVDDRYLTRTARPSPGSAPSEHRTRERVSVNEVTDTGERLRILDRDAEGCLQFRHRIMQAYLAGCCLAERLATDGAAAEGQWIDRLLDRHHPEKLTANMAVTFAALVADVEIDELKGPNRTDTADNWRGVQNAIVDRLLETAAESLQAGRAAPAADGEAAIAATDPDDIDPMHYVDPDVRIDPDDALIKLTTAADVARAIDCASATQDAIVKRVREVRVATRWTKLGAIRAVAALDAESRWTCIWEFAADPDYTVRRRASDALQADAAPAYAALRADIDELIVRAAARSAYNLGLTRAELAADTSQSRTELDDGKYDIRTWRADHEVPNLRALGWVLPSIVSGLREDPSTHVPEAWHGGERHTESVRPSRKHVPGDATLTEHFEAHASGARTALARLVALAFEGGHHDLEESLAQGFKGDAMRHAESVGPVAETGPGLAGPGWVATNSRLVRDVALRHAESWYARMLLYQALGLYAIAGANSRVAFELFATSLRRSAHERHPFTVKAAKMARAGLRRRGIRDRWTAYIWPDEVEITGRRATVLEPRVAQLVADVTLLLDLKEGSAEDIQRPFPYMQELPYCLSRSRDRKEILGTGCPEACGWGLCPYKQPPTDEPNAHRGVSRAFCRQQRQIARSRQPHWQRRATLRKLREFWREMEQRART